MRLRELSLALLAGLLIAGAGADSGAQAPRDTASCRAILSSPTPDSADVRIGLMVRPFDSAAVRMTAAYRALLGSTIRQVFRGPPTLSLRTYGSELLLAGQRGTPTFVTLDLAATYRATLHRDGRLSAIRVTGGTRDQDFDAAMLRALQAVSDSGFLVPPTAPAVVFDGDSVALQFVVARDDVILPARFKPARGDTTKRTPLLRLRTPIRRVTQSVALRGATRPPEYPLSMRASRTEGRTTIDFVVDGSGHADLSTVQVVATPAVDFVSSILEVLPLHRFQPMMVEGCAVSILVREPFEFHFSP